MDEFLPKDYEVPRKSMNYMRLEEGENRFRVLDAPILGWIWWVTGNDGSRKPIRIPSDQKAPETVDKDEIKHFWAMPIWNYGEEKIQILELAQKSIQKAIKNLADDPDWGNPTGYDLVISKSGQKLDTEYQVSPKPAKKLDPGILQLYADMHIDLTALYRGEDPFEASKTEDADKIQNNQEL